MIKTRTRLEFSSKLWFSQFIEQQSDTLFFKKNNIFVCCDVKSLNLNYDLSFNQSGLFGLLGQKFQN